ncbi:AraC family transcriptional regulator [Cohnella sp. CIP 111063]|uniref:AraC family transcriptional regulator n=1 Tax=unclassified Cohnella TaxID=2636738 RepID=UPI000B8BF45B|nr:MULTISPECIES: AraC family transcriptional regulator [unclassified Cohnella]OXS56260.1 AraC family transcriptional regulator [Cohnella sp. CIP 111063]PRX67899.1 AraC-like protein [Cohnella sp. SGD-V74]
MAVPNNAEVPKEKFPMAKQYPIYVADTVGVNSLYQKMHWHDVLEINLIKSGTGHYIINGQKFEFGQGDILLINSNDLHCAYETEGLVMLVVTFDPAWLHGHLRYDPDILSPFKEMGLRFANLLERKHPSLDGLRRTLLDLQEEHVGGRPSHVSMVYSHLLRFLAQVNRDFRMDDLRKPGKKMNPEQLQKVRKVIHAMERHFSHPWTLDELASLVYLSPSRFSDIFRRAAGISPLEYLIRIRLEHAVALLDTTDLKITEIAMECGFRTLSNFNRLFKQHLGSSPRTTKNRMFN